MTQSFEKFPEKVTRLALSIFILAASFYLFEFSLQVSPSVMTKQLMVDFQVGAAGLGFVAAFYFYAYAPMQIPAGLLYDRFGPRRLLTIATLVCSLGAVFFGATSSIALASAGRFFMGIGSAFAFIGVLVLLMHWFPPRYFALMAGIAQMMSSIGAISGEIPLAGLVDSMGWRPAMLLLAGIGFVLALLIWCIIHDTPHGDLIYENRRDHKLSELKKIIWVCRKNQTWATALYAFTIWAPIATFAALWGVPYLEMLYQTSTIVASEAMSMVWIGIGVGSPLFGWWSDRIGRRCFPLYISAFIGVFSTLIIIYVPISLPMMFVVLFFMGIAASGQSLSFAVIKENNRPEHVGTASGFNNMAVVLGGALFQPLVGYVLKLNWDNIIINGIPIYSVEAYQKALFILPICYAVAFIASRFLIKETYARQID